MMQNHSQIVFKSSKSDEQSDSQVRIFTFLRERFYLGLKPVTS
jgi:hypothetical protein